MFHVVPVHTICQTSSIGGYVLQSMHEDLIISDWWWWPVYLSSNNRDCFSIDAELMNIVKKTYRGKTENRIALSSLMRSNDNTKMNSFTSVPCGALLEIKK